MTYMTTIENFKQTATLEQIDAVDRLTELHKEGLAAYAGYREVQDQIDRGCHLARHIWGLQTEMVHDELEIRVDPLLPTRDRCKEKYLQVRGELARLLRRAVGKLDMGHLGYIRRNYESIVGEPLPHNN